MEIYFFYVDICNNLVEKYKNLGSLIFLSSETFGDLVIYFMNCKTRHLFIDFKSIVIINVLISLFNFTIQILSISC